jgi:hypothetical protein
LIIEEKNRMQAEIPSIFCFGFGSSPMQINVLPDFLEEILLERRDNY